MDLTTVLREAETDLAEAGTGTSRNPKPRPNHGAYLEILRSMTPEQKLRKAFELSELGKTLFREGLRRRFPDASEAARHRIFLDRLEKCHNRNY